jgi:hypothetical protein
MVLATDDDDPISWTLDEHLSHGKRALEVVASLDAFQGLVPVCHHFWGERTNDEEFLATVKGERFNNLAADLDHLGLHFEPDRLEAWEDVKLSSNWLQERVPALFLLFQRSGLSGYHGWTCEPPGVQPIGACEFAVINNTTARKSDNAQTH